MGDVFGLSDLLSTFYQLQKLAFALPVLALAFAALRALLWALLSPVLGRFAGFAANAVAAAAAFAFLSQPGALWKAADWGCAVACKALGVPCGGPGSAGPLDALTGEAERSLRELSRALSGL
ncbi:hypothetical protein [Desulfovirgula thermocuniculi]|uniref:hypothetical protein n=1 Tax=Desulfovirgula thermocuniculi TaxID=348842 RepID=UPI0004240C43|nr:hypothetical protein [Desulfovirgula thermocuniculi]